VTTTVDREVRLIGFHIPSTLITIASLPQMLHVACVLVMRCLLSPKKVRGSEWLRSLYHRTLRTIAQLADSLVLLRRSLTQSPNQPFGAR
jgi:hypothetical protein